VVVKAVVEGAEAISVLGVSVNSVAGGQLRTRAPRVGFLTQWYPPEPTTLPTEFAHGLQDAGWNVRVLTGFPNYPSGKVHEGYANRLPQKEIIDGVPVLRTPLYPSHDRSAVRRILNYLTWSASATLGAAWWLAGSDVCLVYGSPLTAAAPAVALKRLRGTPYVIQVQDLWPDSIVESGFSRPLPGAVRRSLERICNRIYAGAAACVVISPGMADILKARGVAAERIHMIYNWADEKTFGRVPPTGRLRSPFGIADGDRVLAYAGNLGPAQGIGRWIEAVHGIEGCHLVLIGDGIERPALQELAARLQTTNVHFHDAVAPGEIPGLVSDADAQLVSLVDSALFKATMPSKMQAALAGGSPLLVSVGGDASAVVTEAGAGLTAAPDDVAAMRAAVRRFQAATPAELRSWGLNGRSYYDARMARAVGLPALSETLGEAMEQRKGRRDRPS
jgi:colanic acid biosynthesis glycosyl transferase WcaI